jgi:hypothetical protein
MPSMQFGYDIYIIFLTVFCPPSASLSRLCLLFGHLFIWSKCGAWVRMIIHRSIAQTCTPGSVCSATVY